MDNRSSEWGTSPAHWYFTSALPKALLPAAIALLFAGLWYERSRAAKLIAPGLCFVVAYSALPHKELRFIFHAIPPLNVVAALGLSAIYRRAFADAGNKGGSALAKLLLLAAVGLLGVSAVASLGFLAVSSNNYTGGVAMDLLHKAVPGDWDDGKDAPPKVHIGVEAAMSGVTRFVRHTSATDSVNVCR